MAAILFVSMHLASAHPTFAVTSGMGASATVVKADFSTSTFRFFRHDTQIELTVKLVNSGGLVAQEVGVFVLYPNELTYESARQDQGAIATFGSRFAQVLNWILDSMDPNEETRASFQFSLPDDLDRETLMFSVAIASDVSVPLHKKYLLALDDQGVQDERDYIQNAFNFLYFRYYTLKRWIEYAGPFF